MRIDDGDDVVDALRVLATPPPWLTAAAQGARVAEGLRREVPELRDGPEQLTACRVEDLRLRGSRWIGRYAVTLAAPDRAPRTVALTGVLNAGGAPGDPSSPSAPFDGPDWSVALSDPSLIMRVADGDRRLAGLAMIIEPVTAAAWLERSLGDTFPGIRIAACEPVVARYRPGQRCTVVCHLAYDDHPDPSWPDVVVAKLHRHGEGAHGYGAVEALWQAGLGDSDRLLIARPLAYRAGDDASLQGYVPQDRSLIELVDHATTGKDDAIAEAEGALRAVADALVALHRAPVEWGPTVVIDDEVASVRKGARALGAAIAELDGAVDPLLHLIEQRAAEFPADPIRPSHGAFRPGQIRLSGDRVGLLDLDGFGMCEPAQDVGRFAGKLRLVALRASTGAEPDPAERLAIADRLVASFLDRYCDQAQVTAVRVTLWEGLDLAKTLLQSWSRVRPADAAPVLALLEHRVAALR